MGSFIVYKWSYSYLLCVYLGRVPTNWSWSYLCSTATSLVLFALAVTGLIPPTDRVIIPSFCTYLSDNYVILLWKITKLPSFEPTGYSQQPHSTYLLMPPVMATVLGRNPKHPPCGLLPVWTLLPALSSLPFPGTWKQSIGETWRQI